MICVNELSQQKCTNHELLQDLVVLIAPFSPHIAEELWHALGNSGTVCDAKWPEYDEKYLKEDEVKMMVSFNGKVRFPMNFPVNTPKDDVEKAVLADERTGKYLGGKNIVKVIVVPNRIINIVIK